ncbi:MAG: hypothetical protein ACHQ0J_10535 [Candidatus Dormibacterales bacterium]
MRRPRGLVPQRNRLPRLLTAEEAIARGPAVLNYKRLWEAELAGRLHPFRDGHPLVRDEKPTFREFMESHGFEGPPDATWIIEDSAAWQADERPPVRPQP